MSNFAGDKGEDRRRAVRGDRIFDAVEIWPPRLPVIWVPRDYDVLVRRPRVCSVAMWECLQDRDPSRVDVCHQLMTGIIAVIGMISLGKPIIGEAECPSR